MDSQERVKRRIARRQRTVAKAIVTPVPVSCCVTGGANGDILKYMFIGSGVINKVKVYLSSKPKNNAVIIIKVENDIDGESKQYSMARRDLIIEPELKIQSGDRLTIHLAVHPEDQIDECWIAMQWIPDIKDTSVKKLFLEEVNENAL